MQAVSVRWDYGECRMGRKAQARNGDEWGREMGSAAANAGGVKMPALQVPRRATARRDRARPSSAGALGAGASSAGAPSAGAPARERKGVGNQTHLLSGARSRTRALWEVGGPSGGQPSGLLPLRRLLRPQRLRAKAPSPIGGNNLSSKRFQNCPRVLL